MGETTKLGLVVVCVVNHKKKPWRRGGRARTGAAPVWSGRRSRHCRDSNKQLGSEAPVTQLATRLGHLSRLGVGAILRPSLFDPTYLSEHLSEVFVLFSCLLLYLLLFFWDSLASHTNIPEAGDWRYVASRLPCRFGRWDSGEVVSTVRLGCRC